MVLTLLKRLLQEGLISEAQYKHFMKSEVGKPLSLHWELKICLAIGVLCLSTGLSMLIYNNLHFFGPTSVITLIFIVTFSCFYYVYRNRQPFSKSKNQSHSLFESYVLLLGCLALLSLLAYLQLQFTFFGNHLGLSTFLIGILFFILAYLYDHQGVLTLSFSTFTTALGITVAPASLFSGANWSSASLIYTGLFFGAAILAVGHLLHQNAFKPHFTLAYYSFGQQVLYLAALAGLFTLPAQRWLFIALIILLMYGFLRLAKKQQSFLLLLMNILYGYVGFTYLVYLTRMFDGFYTVLVYFVGSCAAVVRFLLRYRIV